MKKRIFAAALCAALSLSCLAACGSSTQASQAAPAATEATTALANPITEVGSLEELNEKLGSQIYCPNDIASNQSFCIINSTDGAPIGQYTYNLDGRNYTVRFCSDFNAAISGVYVNGSEIFSDPNASDWHDFTVVKTDDGYCAHWMNISGQYTLLVTDSADMEQSAFEQIARTYSDGTIPNEKD